MGPAVCFLAIQSPYEKESALIGKNVIPYSFQSTVLFRREAKNL